MLEAAGVDFGGNVVRLELPPRADSGFALGASSSAIRNPLPLSSIAGTIYESGSVRSQDAGSPAGQHRLASSSGRTSLRSSS